MFSKCNMGGDTTTNPARVQKAFRRTINASYSEFLFNVSFSSDSNFLASCGAPPWASIRVSVDSSRVATTHEIVINHDVQWFGKPPTKMAESIWFAFAPSTGNSTSGWQMDKLGRWVDPMSVVMNGSTSMHAVWSGVRKVAANGNVLVSIETPDAPVVSPNLDMLPTGAFRVPARPNEGWAWNLFNNAWVRLVWAAHFSQRARSFSFGVSVLLKFTLCLFVAHTQCTSAFSRTAGHQLPAVVAR
jgi:hypothetical protein